MVSLQAVCSAKDILTGMTQVLLLRCLIVRQESMVCRDLFDYIQSSRPEHFGGNVLA